MFGLLLLVVVVPPLVAILLLGGRLRGGVRRQGFIARALATLRDGTRRPIWLSLIVVAAVAAALSAGLEQAYLAVIPDRPGWFDVGLLSLVLALLAASLVAMFVGVASAGVARTRGFGAGTVAGLLTLLAVALGTAAAHLPLKAAYLADPSSFPVVSNLGEQDLLVPFDLFMLALIWALPWPVLGAGLGGRDRRPAVRDVWQGLLELVTADLPDNRAAWGAALRAELAAIEPRAERRRFALGGVWTALRSGPTRGTWLQALGVAILVAGGAFAASRWSLSHGGGGIAEYWLSAPSVLLFAVATATAWRSRSFGAALRASTVVGVAAFAAVLAVSIPEAVVWANRKVGYLSTGDAVPPDWQSAVVDVLRPEFLISMIVFMIVGAASGAVLGTMLSRLPAAAAESPLPSTSSNADGQ